MPSLRHLAPIALLAAHAHAATITPVGPEGRLHHAAAINERGDLLFDLDTVIGLDYEIGDDIPTAELWLADGTVRTILHPGSTGGWAWALGEDATTISHVNYPFDLPEPLSDFRTRPRINAPDGTTITYQGSLPYASFNQITSDGRFIGSAATSPYLDNFDGFVPSTPITWSPISGETRLPLPSGDITGMAWRANRAGLVVGFSNSDRQGDHGRIVWWSDDARILGTFPIEQLAATDPNALYHVGHLTGDGSLIATAGGRILGISAQGVVTPRTEPEPDDAFIYLNDVNRRGFMVGDIISLFGDFEEPGPILWSPSGDKIELQSLFPPDSPWRLTRAPDITDANIILVQAVHRDDHTRFQSFIISDIPAPPTIPLLTIPLLLNPRRR